MSQAKTDNYHKMWTIAFTLLLVGLLFWYLYTSTQLNTPAISEAEDVVSRAFDIPEEKILRTLAERLMEILRPPTQ